MTRLAARHYAPLAAVALLGLSACSSGDDAGVPLAQAAAADSVKRMAAAHALIGPEALAALDSGNVLFRSKRYAPALAVYRAAADLAPQHAAPLFGIYMVARATNDSALADSALAEISKRNGEVPAAAHQFPDSTLKSVHKNVPKARVAG